MAEETPKGPDEPIKWSVFLASIPPGRTARIPDLAQKYGDNPRRFQIRNPDIYLHCRTPVICEGFRIFKSENRPTLWYDQLEDFFIKYTCRNCNASEKLFVVSVKVTDIGGCGEAVKLAERPVFGPPIPSRLLSLIGQESRDLFLKGRRAENQGLGIGAFAYYRRVVENQRNQVIDQIIKVSRRIKASTEFIETLESAKKETQFSRSVEIIKDGIPDILRINGHNPLTLLYKALSQGLHTDSDEECLEIAGNIRLVLTELAEKIGYTLKEQAELDKAVNRLLKVGEKKEDDQ